MRTPLLYMAALAGLFLLPSCSTDPENREQESHQGRGEHDGEGRGEHDRDGGERGEGEESGTELQLTDKYDQTRNGAHLMLAYDATGNCFVGTVQNTTDAVLEKVRVEVHLSNGKELGPTIAVNLAPGAKIDVELRAESKGFERWNAHPEVGSGEHGHGGEGGEHGGEGRREHK